MYAYTVALSQKTINGVYKRCPIKTINYEQGLLNNGTTNIITDALGYTWVSTKTGLQRYNGYTLETINPIAGTGLIPINAPVYLFKLKNDCIWISCKAGVIEYDIYKNVFTKIISVQNDNLSLSFIPLQETNAGIWGLQYNKGIVLYDLNGKFIRNISDNDSVVNNIFRHHQIFNNVAFTANDHSLFIYNYANEIKQFNMFTNEISYIKEDATVAMCCSHTHLYTISGSTIKSIDIAAKKDVKIIFLKTITGENTNISSCSINERNDLLVGLNNHLYEFDSLCNYITEYTDYNLNPVGDVGFINTIYADNFKRIWLLCNDNIKRIQNFTIPFQHYIYSNEKNNFVRSIYYDEQKHILLAGCYNGGLQLFDSSGNHLWQNAIASDSVKDINAIERLNANDYLIETIGRGMYVFNLPLRKISRLQIQYSAHGLPDYGSINFINNVQRISDSTLFIATSSNVYNCIIKNEKIVAATPLIDKEKINIPQVDCFIFTHDKTLWIGTVTGTIYKINSDQSLRIIQIPDNYQVRSFAEDAANNIWIGTDKGLYVYNSTGSYLKNFTVQSGLLNDCIYALLPVAKSAGVFASTNLGLSYVSLNNNIINYTKESGLQENEFNTGSATETAGGKFYFGGVNGITAFNSTDVSRITDKPVITISHVSADDLIYTFSGEHIRNDSIFLNYNQNHIQLDVAALGLLNTDEYVYQYHLKNYDADWQTTRHPTGIRYVLPPGKYVFEIKCSPVFSPGSIFNKSFLIIVSPAWWQTAWFKSLLVFIGISMIAFIVQQYSRRRYLERITRLEFQQQLQKERERISRDLHDNLGSYAAAISSNISFIKKRNNETDESVFSQLKNNSESIITELKDTIWALNKEAISFTAIIDRFKVFLQKINPNYPDIFMEINEDIKGNATLSPVNALHLFRIMQEAVNNALRHSECHKILLSVTCDKDWKISILDDGIGIPANNNIEGNGLQNIKLRCKEAGWQTVWINAVPKGTELIISSKI